MPGQAPARNVIVVNEGAGSARSERVRQAVELTQRAINAEIYVTATRDASIFESWLEERAPNHGTLVVAGGDGSLGVAYNVAHRREALTLGYIPAGFGNATAHLLRLPRKPDELAAVIAAADARPVDLVAVDGRLALFAGAGWDALVARRYAESGARRLPGWTAAVARSVPDLWRPVPVEVRADGWRVHDGPMELLVVGTTPFYGRGLRVNPGARPDAARLALRVYPGPARSLALEAARWALRRMPDARAVHAGEVTVRTIDGSSLPVQADGDVLGERPDWQFTVRPAAIRLIGRWSAAEGRGTA